VLTSVFKRYTGFSIKPEQFIHQHSLEYGVSMYCRSFIITIALLLISCSGPKTPEEIIQQGKSLTANKQYSEAILIYKNALQDDPSLMDIRIELGTIYYSLGDITAAERFFLNAYDADYTKQKVVPLLAATFFQQNNMAALKKLLSEQPKNNADDSFNLQLALYQVLLLSRSNQFKLAKQQLQELLASSTLPVKDCELCHMTQAHIQSVTSPTDALNTLDKLLLTYPQNAQAYLLRGQLYFALRNPKMAMQNFKQFQLFQPRAGYVQFLIAVTAMQMKDFGSATQYVDNLLAANPKQPLVNHLKALLVFQQKDYEAARKHAQLSIDRGLKSPANYLMAGVSAYHQDRMEIAYGHLQKAVVFYPDNQQLQRLLMLIQLKFGYLEEANKSYVKQDQRNVQDVLLGNVMAYRFIQNEQYDEAGGVLEYLANTPISKPAIRLQTQALQNQLKLKEMISTKELIAPSKDKSTETNLLRIMLLLESNDPEKAQQDAQQWLDQEPENIDALNMLAYVFLQLDKPNQAKPLFEQALAIKPNNTPSLFFLAQQSLSQANYSQASIYYQSIIKAAPQNLSALRSLLQLTFKSQSPPNWAQLLKNVDLSAVSDEQIVAISDAIFQWQEYQYLDTYLSHYKGQSEWSDLVWMVWLKNRFYLLGVDQFKSDFELYFESNPLIDHFLYALTIIENKKQYPLMLELIASVPESMQNVEAVQMQKALALLELQRFEEVHAILKHFETSQEFRDARLYINGRLMQHKGELAQAASYLTAYYNARPNFHSVSALSTVLVADKRHDDLVTLANEYVTNFPADNSARLSLAFKIAPTQPKVAIEFLASEQVQWLILRNWKLSNNLASLYLLVQQPEKAELYSNNALKLNPDNNQVRILHANILLRLQQKQKAISVLKATKQPDKVINNLLAQLETQTFK
jgi:putative PEP-CTERM system TPR-repeat lipoprotein